MDAAKKQNTVKKISLIGITGTLGAGKSTVARYLKERRGFEFVSVRSFLEEECRRRGLSINRDSLLFVANDLRETNGPESIIRELLASRRDKRRPCVIESVREAAGALYLKAEGGVIWAIIAEPKERYRRIEARKSETDKITYRKFLADEKRESTRLESSQSNLALTIKLADAVIENNGSEKLLFAKIDSLLEEM